MKRALFIILAIGLLILVIASVTFTVGQNEYAVVTRFGKHVKTITAPGLYWKAPTPVERVNRFDKRLMLHKGLLLERLTKDKKNVSIQCMVVWRISDPLTFYTSVTTVDAAGQQLDDLLTSRSAGAVGDYDFDDLISVDREIKISELEERIEKELAERLAEGNYGLEIVSVELDRLALPESNAWAVYQRMRKERKARANLHRAEGEREAAKIKAQADRDKSDILARAYEKSQKIRAEGEAEAAKVYAEAFTKDPEFYKFWRTMQSYDKILDEKTTLVLSSDSELLKYLGE